MTKIDGQVYGMIVDMMKAKRLLGGNPCNLGKEVIMLAQVNGANYYHYLEQYTEAIQDYHLRKPVFFEN